MFFKYTFSAETLHEKPLSQGDVRTLPLLSNFLPFDNAATCLSSSLFLACKKKTFKMKKV